MINYDIINDALVSYSKEIQRKLGRLTVNQGTNAQKGKELDEALGALQKQGIYDGEAVKLINTKHRQYQEKDRFIQQMITVCSNHLNRVNAQIEEIKNARL